MNILLPYNTWYLGFYGHNILTVSIKENKKSNDRLYYLANEFFDEKYAPFVYLFLQILGIYEQIKLDLKTFTKYFYLPKSVSNVYKGVTLFYEGFVL